MSLNIFPAEIIEYSTEQHFSRNNAKTRAIYLIVLVFIMLAFISLWFLKVEVSVKGSGMLRAVTERNTINAPVSGRIKEVFIRENQYVKTREQLFTLETDVLDNQEEYIARRQKDIQQQMGDLKQLTAIRLNNETLPGLSLISSLYTQQYHLFRQQVAEAELELANARKVHARQEKLYTDRVIASAEFDQYDFELKTAGNKLRLVYEQQITQWQSDLNNLRLELGELASERGKYQREKEFYTVSAPLSGTIQHFTGVRTGSFVSVGETIAEISPDSGLIAQIYVSPKDIGLLRQDIPVRFQIDAFNYNEWGMVEGQVMDISNDIVLVEDNMPVFLVRCRMDKDALELPNGYSGKLKKGMTLSARFVVTERSLFQLLYDKADDWLNPNRIPGVSAASN